MKIYLRRPMSAPHERALHRACGALILLSSVANAAIVYLAMPW